MTNHYKVGHFKKYQIKKKWMEGENTITPPAGAYIQLQMYYTTDWNNAYMHTGGDPYKDTVILDESTGWEFLWRGLPAENDAGTPLFYYVVETDCYPANFAAEYEFGEPGTGDLIDGTWTIKNKKDGTNLEKITVVKKWLDENGYIITEPDDLKDLTAKVALFRQEGYEPVIPVKPCTVTATFEGTLLGESVAVSSGDNLNFEIIVPTEGYSAGEAAFPVDMYVNGEKHIFIYDPWGQKDIVEETIMVEGVPVRCYKMTGTVEDIRTDVNLEFKIRENSGLKVPENYNSLLNITLTDIVHPSNIQWIGNPEIIENTTIDLPKVENGNQIWKHTWELDLPTEGEDEYGDKVYYRYFALELDGSMATYLLTPSAATRTCTRV